MEFDWLDAPFDLKSVSPREIEESFEDPFSIRLLPEQLGNGAESRFFNLGKPSARPHLQGSARCRLYALGRQHGRPCGSQRQRFQKIAPPFF